MQYCMIALSQTQKENYPFRTKYQVSIFAGALKKLGALKGDRVIIYMPMIPEALVAMLACSRIGAIHSVVFGGFASNELAVRIDDCKPKIIVSARVDMNQIELLNINLYLTTH